MSSWIIVDEQGREDVRVLVEPAEIPVGKRLSVQGYVYGVPSGKTPFFMEYGTATGEAVRYETKGVFILTVVGSDVADVKTLRKIMTLRLSTKGLQLPQYLAGPWERFLWLLRWIWNDEIS